MMVVVTRVEDFDMASNSFWQNGANRSYPREGMVCCTCNKPVVMSNFAFAEKPKKEQIICFKCLVDVSRETEKESKKGA